MAVKLSPFYSSLPHLARRLDEAGVDGLVLFNRFYQPDIDIEALEVARGLELSSSAELPLRLTWLAVLSASAGLSLAASGGVHTGIDAVKAVMAGAHAVQLVSALLRHGVEHLRIVREAAARWLEEHEYDSLRQMQGSMNLARCPDPSAFERFNYVRVLQSWRSAAALVGREGQVRAPIGLRSRGASMARIHIDGVPHETVGDETLLEALRRLGHDVPTLCNDERLVPQAVCRLCVVEVSGLAHPVPACATRPEEGMEVRTRSPEIDLHRRMTLELLAHRHPPEALHDPLEHDFIRHVRQHGLADALQGRTDPLLVDDSHPYIHVDMSRCIDCYRCVRICDDVQGQSVWKVWNRGDQMRHSARLGHDVAGELLRRVRRVRHGVPDGGAGGPDDSRARRAHGAHADDLSVLRRRL